MNTQLVVESAPRSAVTCLVCGNEIAPGEGVTEVFGDHVVRLKCPGCAARFRADPHRYLTDGPAACCEGDDTHA